MATSPPAPGAAIRAGTDPGTCTAAARHTAPVTANEVWQVYGMKYRALIVPPATGRATVTSLGISSRETSPSPIARPAAQRTRSTRASRSSRALISSVVS